ncbi:polyphosphate:nucleotide phosphotransferase, PPK2 family [Formosa sp. Hel1_31_208]|uniref:PPK2 family polyphosphate kinase n=1 Tax=Formosa sp. Hel1_31_208 TaxID=1798225 RepID=UPI00087A8117|nr:PPK2 family polyphosphate kinase [Formosa sp. Hel1_31_208]SDS60340.1 polyphosphate:nucleotide phosphotransferase, PPK2 family [Formosa sp. Hel1_31_208]
MENININQFKVNESIQLKNVATTFDLGARKKAIEKELEEVREKLGDFQNTIYAHGKYAILICIQGMDTAGKDSMIREVFKDFNTRGIVVHSFKVPTELELNHDYLWRHYIALPARGKFGVFNRTHYENVLVTRVHPGYILGESLPDVKSIDDVNDAFWTKRFRQINDFEKHIVENGTIIFKFFLHLSKEEQKNRLLRRLNRTEKHWKFSPGDLKERKLWDSYQECYEDAINRTSKSHAPWYTIPADDKPTARYIVARILYDTLIQYKDIVEPELEADIKKNIGDYIKQLENE